MIFSYNNSRNREWCHGKSIYRVKLPFASFSFSAERQCQKSLTFMLQSGEMGQNKVLLQREVYRYIDR